MPSTVSATSGILVTTEHGGNRIPRRWAGVFRGRERLLHSHRGWDPGALALANRCARALGVDPLNATVSRLLVDLNRSRHNPEVFSPWSASLDDHEKALILERHYRPHREAVVTRVEQLLQQHPRVVQLAWHTFTPVLRGQRRSTDFAVLFDPDRPAEQRLADEICERVQMLPLSSRPLRVHHNRPYLGVDDGFTTQLRLHYGPRLLGIELELNQRFVRRGGTRWQRILRLLPEAVAGATAEFLATDGL
jgi:predicted N-formylglutamate amidohydrolase